MPCSCAAPAASYSPRRRATLLLAVIALLTLLAVITLIALRAEKIGSWLAWPTPASQLIPGITARGLETAPGIVLAHALRMPARLAAASP